MIFKFVKVPITLIKKMNFQFEWYYCGGGGGRNCGSHCHSRCDTYHKTKVL